MIDVAKWSFAVGHVFNDLCASMWFLFTLPYLTKVLLLKNTTAGDIILIGQVFDAIATPLIGIESDRKGFICGSRIGNRKSWHLLGTVLTAVSFPFIFISFFDDTKTIIDWYIIIYYTPFVAIFQFAWATVQVTHLSLIPIMVKEGKDNSSLNSLRYMFTIAANVIVLVSTTLIFQFRSSPSNGNKNNQSTIGPSEFTLTKFDKPTFEYLSIGIVALGLFFSAIFHFGVREHIDINEESENGSATELSSLMRSVNERMSKSDWFREPQFYLINCIYLSTRLIVNVSQVYLVIYVIETLRFRKIDGSMAALTTFLSGAVSSIILKRIQQKIGKKICFLTGLVFIAAFCVIVGFSYKPAGNIPAWQMYLSMVILGIGCSIIMIGSLSLTADLIGPSCSSSAFVYGCMSFSDKLFNGIAIWVLQRLGPVSSTCSQCLKFYYRIELYFVGGCALFAFVVLMIIFPMKIGARGKNKNDTIQNISDHPRLGDSIS